ncbi:hypothetical protein IMZ48_06195 [Candidatus Bathyarchaeota archaeon]|nr:hypothetical protein [Candidatus Bathyarchaeota archaeon]
MDCLPPPAPRITRIAANLSSCPAELIEPVIGKLELHRIFALLASPAARPVLLGAIENSPAWAWLFRYGGDTSGFRRLKDVWVAFGQLALLKKRPVSSYGFDVTPQFLDGHCMNTRLYIPGLSSIPRERPEARAKLLLDYLEKGLIDSFARLLKGLVPTQLAAICIFLPAEPLDVLKTPERTEGGTVHPKH